MKEFIVGKLLSGRFLFTIITASVFAYMSISGKLPSDKVMEVVLVVLYAYFNKPQVVTGKENGVNEEYQIRHN